MDIEVNAYERVARGAALIKERFNTGNLSDNDEGKE